MNRVIIATSKLNKEIWTNIYRFICGIREEKESKYEAFEALKKETEMRVTSYYLDRDVYSLYGEVINTEKLTSITKDTCVSIIYKKTDDSEDFIELIPFILLQKEFQGSVSMGIDVEGINKLEKQNKYYFKCSNFFFLHDKVKPKCGERDLYFIGININEKDGITNKVKNTYHKVHSLAGKAELTDYTGDSNRRFLPLIHISMDNFQPIFGISHPKNPKSKNCEETEKDYNLRQADGAGIERDKKIEEELSFIRGSIKKINSEFTRKKKYSQVRADLSSIFNSSNSLFGQWIEGGYFYSFIEDGHSDIKPNEIQGIRNTLQIYKNSIFEIVQNIMFHGGKDGILYCEFVKKSNISKSNSEFIPGFEKYEDDNRFLRIGIFDFSNRGIVDTYNKGKGDKGGRLSLKDFFDPNSIEATGMSHLNMRYAARLGIKTFVRNIFKSKGFFSVESNQAQNDEKKKKRLFSFVKEDKIELSEENIVVFANGTHYEIILPVVATETTISRSFPFQRESFFSLDLKGYLQKDGTDLIIQDIQLNENLINKIAYSENKEDQIASIEKLGNEIIDMSSNKREIAINLSNRDYDSNTIFKLLAYLQLKDNNGFKTIILINSKNSLVDNICEFVKYTLIDRGETIWDDDSAIIFVTDNLRVQILNGSTTGDLFSINHECHKYYSYESNYFDYDKKPYDQGSDLAQKFSDFIFPYEFRVRRSDAVDKPPYFMDALKAMFRRKILSDKPGYLVNHENTYIGNKIIVKNYYEADTMFQNSFFTERLAYLISLKIQKELSAQQKTKELVLIGYKYYSEFLLKAIKKLLTSKDLNQDNIHLVIANDEKDALKVDDIDFIFDRRRNQEGKSVQDVILESPDNFHFITIVPIGSTLSTNDKIIAFFKLWFNKEKDNSSKAAAVQGNLDNKLFIFNHCVVVVRDMLRVNPTELERSFKWKSIDAAQEFIETRFENAQKIHFTIQIAGDSLYHNWISRFNLDPSFPSNWQEEKYVNFTLHSSTNSQNIMGFPLVSITDEDTYDLELKRLFAFKDYTYKGHIGAHHTHHKYYIDTESFAKKNIEELNKWLAELKQKEIFKSNVLNVIITPNSESDSDFIYAINKTLFDSNALVLFLDVHNQHGNIMYKYSFLKDLKKVHFHYVDQMLLTGRSFYKTKSHLFAILNQENQTIEENIQQKENDHETNKDSSKKEREVWRFSSIIAIMNRLPYAITNEIKYEVNDHLFVYADLFYPATKDSGQECELCELKKYYEKLKERTVLESCSRVIRGNIIRLEEKSFKPSMRLIRDNDIIRQNQEFVLLNQKSNHNKRGNFIRLLLTHEFYYRISQIERKNSSGSNSYNERVKKIKHELDGIYQQIGGHDNRKDNEKNVEIDSKIISYIDSDELFGCQFSGLPKILKDYYNKKLGIDLKISFLKVISSPPLSKYIFMRKYAHEKLLSELNEILPSKDVIEVTKHTLDDLRMVKAILKSLSLLKSNALVRKDVIIGVWHLLDSIVNDVDHNTGIGLEYVYKEERNILNKKNYEVTELRNIEKRLNDLSNGIDKKVSPMLTIDFEKPMIEEQIKEQRKVHEDVLCRLEKDEILLRDIKASIESDKKNSNDIIEDFSRDFQFFIKNAIIEDEAKATYLGELLRTGEEMKIDSVETINAMSSNEPYEIQISKTKLSIRRLHMVNNIFNHNFNNSDVKEAYVDFLVLVFYDNTTIIRKTLEDFARELNKNREIHNCFIHNGKLREIQDFKNDIKNIRKRFRRIINKEYYYTSFKPYLNNGDRINFLEKLIFVTYAKRKLKEIINKDHEISIEKDTKDLMEIFASIMGADAAFFSMLDGKQPYPISLFGKIGNKTNEWDSDNWFLSDNYYTNQVFSYKIKTPLIPKFNIHKNYDHSIFYGEDTDLKARTLGIYLVANPESEKVIAAITFLYHKNNVIIKDENRFRINFQESGRLLLLLKSQINEYVINFLIKDKISDLWIGEQKSTRKFERIYMLSDHGFGKYEVQNELGLDKLKKNDLVTVWESYFMHTNQIITHMYSNICKNNQLTLDLSSDAEIKIKDIFDSKFKYLLKNGFKKRWYGHLIIIDKSGNNKTHFNKQILRAFVVQCIDNAMSKHMRNHDKEVKLIIRGDEVEIRNDFGSLGQDIITNEMKEFERKRRIFEDLRCYNYNYKYMTFISILGYCRKYNFIFKPRFNNQYFLITIKL
jgi:hypothetical protein